MALRRWKADGLVEQAWKRLDPPTRDELARRLGLKAATNISKLNTGNMLMTDDYAERICAVVPGLTAADLGAPEDVVAELAPTVLDRLARLEDRLERVLAALVKAGIEIPESTTGGRSSPSGGGPRQARLD